MPPNPCPSSNGKNLANTTSGNPMEPQQPEEPKSRLPYTIYKHRLELSKRKRNFIDLANTKFSLTYELIKNTIQNGQNCSAEDMAIASRETNFQTKILREIDKYNAAQQVQMTKSYNRRYQKFQKQVQQKEEEKLMESLKTESKKVKSKNQSNPQSSCNDNGKNVREDKNVPEYNGTLI